LSVTEPAATLVIDNSIALITFNRPHALNAVNRELADAVGTALQEVQQSDRVRAVVVTGAGRAFCAGADLKEMAAGLDSYPTGHREWDFAGLVRHWIDKPVIAAVNGFALGGGTEIVLACDLAVIDGTASLGLPEVRRGLIAAAGGLLRLQRQIPFKIASEIALTGAPISAVRAYELGLVNVVASEGQALEEAMRLATTIAANAPLALRETKRLLHRAVDAGSVWDDAAWELNQMAMNIVLSSADANEGATAFAEKRRPVWHGE
jgi:enoyl-CoA hydratase/carnithine racemase